MSGKNRSPPPEYRFRKGESGNPNGRPSGKAKQRSSVFDIITEPVLTIRTGETTITMSAEDALHLKTYQQAINGDKKAWPEVLDMIIAREKVIDAKAAPGRGIELLSEVTDPRNAFEAMVLLDIAAYDMERGDSGRGDILPYLLLEPWAVQMALSRRSLTELDESSQGLVYAWTRDSETLKWPPRFGHV